MTINNMPTWSLAAALAMLAACVPPGGNYQTDGERLVAPYIGRDYWTRSPFDLYRDTPSCSIVPGTCVPGPTGYGKFHIDGTKGGGPSQEVMAHFVFENGVRGYARITFISFVVTFQDHPPSQTPPSPPKPQTYPRYIDRLPAKEAERLRQLPGVELGMSQQQVLATVWGKPDKVKEIKRAHSDRIGWYYRDGSALFFEDGYLYAIEK
ncbi:MAG TPA: hypothetical protein VL899_13170 [Alphaproteobacteria bacterium]|nr:hypothetical protein [Alphaproteobacteria bacterium]